MGHICYTLPGRNVRICSERERTATFHLLKSTIGFEFPLLVFKGVCHYWTYSFSGDLRKWKLGGFDWRWDLNPLVLVDGKWEATN